MKKGDIIITFRENVGTIAYNVSNGRWCVYFPNEESFEGQSDVNESVMYTVLTKEEIEEFLKQEEYEPCPINETLDKMSALTGISIPQEEYIERPAAGIPTTAQIVDASKQV